MNPGGAGLPAAESAGMKGRQAYPAFFFILLCAAFTYGLIRLFSVQFAAGEVYPEYSTLRTDPAGAKLLYDSLALTPGLTVARNFEPLDAIGEATAAIFLLSLFPDQFGASEDPYLKTIERLAARGNRIVVAMDFSWRGRPEEVAELERRWHVRFGVDAEKSHVHHLYFAEARDWQVLDRAGSRLLAIQRDFGKGSVVLISGSDDFSNQSTAAMDRLPLISAAIGSRTRVVFDEAHLGIAESGSVVALARRFRLLGTAAGLAVCAVLFLWKNAAAFPPPAPAAHAESLAGRTSLSGLVTLLRRHVPPADLAATCWRKWLVSNRRGLSPERLHRAEMILRDRGRAPVDAIREIQSILHLKGPL
jgi:hypothetical protein